MEICDSNQDFHISAVPSPIPQDSTILSHWGRGRGYNMQQSNNAMLAGSRLEEMKTLGGVEYQVVVVVLSR